MPVHLTKRRGTPPIDRRRLLSAARRLLRDVGAAECDLSILLCGDPEIHALNRTFRKRDRPTDVLSFSQVEGEVVPGSAHLLGDVVISLPTAARQARARSARGAEAFFEEVVDLLVHGVLHLLGREHEGVRPAVARAMFREQRQLVAGLLP